MDEDYEPKHTVIIDTDLHIQDPHEIILSYFNTSNDSQFIFGKRKAFIQRVMGMFVAFTFMKFFFQELFTGFWFFILALILSLILGFVIAVGSKFAVQVVKKAARGDGVRGVFLQLTFMTLIVLLIGIFI